MKRLSDKEQIFLKLVTAGLWEQDIRLADYGKIDYNEVYQITEEQSVFGIIAASLEHISDMRVPQQWALQFARQTIQLEKRNRAMNRFIAELIAKMQGAGIYSLLVKGQGIALCYERPLWRSSGDVDLLLSAENYERAKRFLLPLATYVEEEESDRKHLALKINEWLVELHGTLYGKWFPEGINLLVEKIQKSIFYEGEVRSWENNKTVVFLPSPDNDVVLVFTHILEHLFVGGIGLRQICDWTRLLWKYHDVIDQQLLAKRLSKACLMSEWKVFAALSVDWLGMNPNMMPFYDSKSVWAKKANLLISIILESGNFGHNRDLSYSRKYSYFSKKMISFLWHFKDYLKLLPIFPVDSSKVFMKVLSGRLLLAAKGK